MIGHVTLFVAALVAAAATALGLPAPTASEGNTTRPAHLTGYAVRNSLPPATEIRRVVRRGCSRRSSFLLRACSPPQEFPRGPRLGR
jgi:hypothetical protein